MEIVKTVVNKSYKPSIPTYLAIFVGFRLIVTLILSFECVFLGF